MALICNPDYHANKRLTNMNIQITHIMQQAHAMLDTTRQLSNNRIGLILGPPGTGKTVAGNWLTEQFPNAHRLCCYANMSKKQLLVNLASVTGLQSQTSYVYDTVMTWLQHHATNHIYVIDEANHLSWRHLEALRYLTDEAGASAVLVGTELLTHTLQDRRTATYLAQMNSRIGAKTVKFQPFPDDDLGLRQIVSYFLTPRFGLDKPKQSLARAFLKACGGNWRLGNELADACQRVMNTQNFSELSSDVINAAAVHLAKI